MKNILLAISGLTPQIVTETLFALTVQKKINIDEIFIITTTRGKSVIEGKDKSKTTPSSALKKEINNLCKNREIKPPKFNVNKNVIVAEEESLELYDIKTDKENLLFPNKAAEIIKILASNSDTAIYASLSGGRKSMSAHIALVMSLFARSQDKLYHVLTEQQFEFQNFYPKTKEEEKALIIAEIPFVKLRSLNAPLFKSGLSYTQLVNKAQKQLQFLTENSKLIIELKLRRVKFKERIVNLTPIEIGIYLLFVENKITTGNGYSNAEIGLVGFAEKLKNTIVENFNYYIDPRDTKHWSLKGLTSEYYLASKSKINKKISSLFNEVETFDEYKITTKKIYGNSSYFIKAPKNKLGINYE